MNSTRELVEQFLQTYSERTQVSYRSAMRIDVLEKMEKSLGKNILEFNNDDIFEFFKVCYDEEIAKSYSMAARHADVTSSIYKKFFEWYIDNIELIRNPVDSSLRKRIKDYMESNIPCVLTKEEVDSALAEIPKRVDPDYTKYIELIVRLFYEGIQVSKDLLLVKWEDFDYAQKTLSYNGAKLKLSERLCELLKYNDNETDIIIYRHLLKAERFRNSLIKVFIRDRDGDIDNRKIESLATVIDTMYKRNFCEAVGFDHSYKQVYYCGLYNHIVNVMGKEEADRTIRSRDRTGDNTAFKKALASYGVNLESGVTAFKNALVQYIPE